MGPKYQFQIGLSYNHLKLAENKWGFPGMKYIPT